MFWLVVLFYLLGVLAVAATILPIWRTTLWWVRLCDFPRFQIALRLAGSPAGRGFFNTYPAGAPGFRYPLDYVFHTPHFAICEMRVLPRFQSDHLPLIATLCLTPDPAVEANKG